jgi:epsilon-lactone hydrolase
MNTGRRLALASSTPAPRQGLRLSLLKRVLRVAVSHIERQPDTVSTRKLLTRLATLSPPPVVARRKDVTIGGVRCRWFAPHGKVVDDTVVVHFHGGGFSMCSVRDTHDFFLADYAALTRRRVVGVDYRKAPEYPFPIPIEDCLSVYRALLAEGIPATKIVFSGDSAGGNLCLAVGQRVRQEGLPMPRSMILMSPWVDLELKGQTIGKHEHSDYITRPVLQSFVRSYLGDHDPTDPLASPCRADFAGFPPLFVQVGGAEAMLSEVRWMVCRAQSHGVDAHIEEWADMVHAFQGFSVFLPDAKRALRSVGYYLDGQHRDVGSQKAVAPTLRLSAAE